MNGGVAQMARVLPTGRASEFRRLRFKAWKPGVNGEAHPLDCDNAETLDQAFAKALHGCAHKDWITVLQTDTITGDQLLVTAVVRQGKPVWRKCPDTLVSKQFRDLFADRQMPMKVRNFEPVEAWRWEPGADVVGHRDPGFIDHRVAGPEAH